MISVPFGQYAGSKARRSLHEQLLQSIVQKSIYFFQTTPFGRVMNRFSSDMAVIDKVNLLRIAAVRPLFFSSQFGSPVLIYPRYGCSFFFFSRSFSHTFLTNRKSPQQVNDFFNSYCCVCAPFYWMPSSRHGLLCWRYPLSVFTTSCKNSIVTHRGNLFLITFTSRRSI